MSWLTLLTAVFTFGTQVFKYLRERDEADKECAIKLKRASDAVKKARKTKDTTALEAAFFDLGLSGSANGVRAKTEN